MRRDPLHSNVGVQSTIPMTIPKLIAYIGFGASESGAEFGSGNIPGVYVSYPRVYGDT